MSRRDTIIIAVLLNAGLLVVLFVTSLKPENSVPSSSAISIAPTPLGQEEQVVIPPTLKAPQPTASISLGEEVEQTVKSYVPPLLSTSVEPQMNFAQDLTAIAEPVSPPEVVPSAPALASAEFKEIKVQKGDVLERIAKRQNVTVEEIMKANKLQTARLKIGQTLKIPTKSLAKSRALKTSLSEEASVKYYTVKQGDNPWTIAVRNHMKVEDLLKLNNLDEEKARRLKPGDRIRIQ